MSFTVLPPAIKTTVWAKEAWRQTMYESAVGTMLNSGVVYRPREFEGQNTIGQNLVYTYVGKLNQLGLGEGSTLDGNEEALDIGSFTMRVGIARYGVLNPNDDDTIESIQSNFNFEDVTRQQIKDLAVTQLDWSLFYQLAGAAPTSVTLSGQTYSTAATLQNVFGQNEIIAPSADRIIRAGNVANDQSLTVANKMTLSLIDFAKELLANSNQQMGFLNTGAIAQLWISPEQEVDLKQDTDSPITWYNNVLAQAAGGDDKYLTGVGGYANRIRPIGTYAGVDIFMHPRVAYGVNSSNNASIPTVRRAVLVGKNAISYASRLGSGRATDKDVPMVFKVQLKDYEYYKGIEGRVIYGLRKATPSNGSDIGVVVISTYAAGHTS